MNRAPNKTSMQVIDFPEIGLALAYPRHWWAFWRVPSMAREGWRPHMDSLGRACWVLESTIPFDTGAQAAAVVLQARDRAMATIQLTNDHRDSDMNRAPSNTEPSRLAGEHIEKLNALRAELEALDSFASLKLRHERLDYIMQIARTLHAARAVLE